MNNIIGCTLNPVNQLLSCGGSSGGTKLDLVIERLFTAKCEFVDRRSSITISKRKYRRPGNGYR